MFISDTENKYQLLQEMKNLEKELKTLKDEVTVCYKKFSKLFIDYLIYSDS
jgi:hypothetical protein